MHLEPVLHKRSHPDEKPARHNEESRLLAANREKLRATTKTHHSPPPRPAQNDQPKIILITQRCILGASMVVQWLKLCTQNAGGPGLIPGQGTRSLLLQLRLSTAKQVSKYFLEKSQKKGMHFGVVFLLPLNISVSISEAQKQIVFFRILWETQH